MVDPLFSTSAISYLIVRIGLTVATVVVIRLLFAAATSLFTRKGRNDTSATAQDSTSSRLVEQIRHALNPDEGEVRAAFGKLLIPTVVGFFLVMLITVAIGIVVALITCACR
jgi:hypothetical protein